MTSGIRLRLASLAGVSHGFLLFVCCLAAASAIGQERAAQPLMIAAASDLQPAAGEIVAQFKEHVTTEVLVTYGASGSLHAQIANGAPFDVFLSADLEYPRNLIASGNAVAGSFRPFARGALVLCANVPLPEEERDRSDLKSLALPRIHHIAIANPKHAPYGRAAESALRRAGMLDTVAGKLVYGENVRQAFEFVVSGNAEAGLVSRSLMKSVPAASRTSCRQLPLESYPPLDQAAVVTRHGAGNRLARSFVEFLSGPEAREILERYGFLRPSTETPPPKVTR